MSITNWIPVASPPPSNPAAIALAWASPHRIPVAGAHQEFKGTSRVPLECDTSPLTGKDGRMRVPNGRVPSGPEFGVRIDPEWVRRGKSVRTP